MSGLGVVSAVPRASSGDGRVVDLVCDKADGPASISVDTPVCSANEVASAAFSLSSDLDFLALFRGGSGTSEGSLASSAWSSVCTGLRFLRERRVGAGGEATTLPP